MANRRSSALKEEYNRVRKNLLQNIRRMKERGFELPSKYVPQIPKKITEKSIARLKKLNENRYKRATDRTGKKGTGEALRHKRYSERSKRSAETRKKKANDKSSIYLDNLKAYILEQLGKNPRATEHLIKLLDTMEDDEDLRYSMMDNIEANYNELVEGVNSVVRYQADTVSYERAYTSFYRLLNPISSAEQYADYMSIIME